MLLAGALLSVGIGLVAGYVVRTVWPAGGMLATLLLWLGMLVPVLFAYSRSRPVGLLKLRPADLLYGVVFGVGLRVIKGALSAADGDSRFPTLTTVDGSLASGWWFIDLIAPVLVAPLIEEFFFHGLVLVVLYNVLRRPLGMRTAGLVGWLVTLALFVFVHAAVGETSTSTVVSLALLAAVCGMLVLFTGRIWGAVLVHVGYNAALTGLSLVGTVLA